MNSTVVTLFVSLLAGHFAADFALQTEEFVRRKREIGTLLLHALVVALASYFFIGIPAAWPLALAAGAIHALIDFAKTRASLNELALFLGDQILHFLVLALLAWAAAARLAGVTPIWVSLFGPVFYRLLVILIGALAVIYASSFAVDIAVRPLVQPLRSEAEQNQSEAAAERRRRLLGSGRVIGYLERALIYMFVLANAPLAIGFLIAAKSLFRFAELTDRANRLAAEYIIIGTLMSFLLGLLCAYAARALLMGLPA